VNQEALTYMREHGKACFWSRSRGKLWPKGETSGDWQVIKHMALDCDQDTLLIQVEQLGKGACHTGTYTCFGDKEMGIFDVVNDLFAEIKSRRNNPREGSYTNYLQNAGVDKICKKIGEEAAETIIAAKNESADELIEEVADLVYHLAVLLETQNLQPKDILLKLKQRRNIE